MKTPEFNVSNMYSNGYCGCPLCVKPTDSPITNKYEIIQSSFNNSVIYFKTRKYKDERGYFQECWNQQAFNDNIISNINFVQDNMSNSIKNVFRGMHFQHPTHPQAKLVNCVYGKVIDFVIDIRTDSMYYGKAMGFELFNPSTFLFIPAGFAHGFYTLEPSVFSYKVSDYRYAEEEHGISLIDTIYPLNNVMCINQNKECYNFCIDILKDAIMSQKDSHAPSLKVFSNMQEKLYNN